MVGRPVGFEVGEFDTEFVMEDATVKVLRLGLGPPVRGRGGCPTAAAADDDDEDDAAGGDCIAIRVLGDFGGRAAAYRMPV